MCGIFGAIGGHINSGIIRALTIANRERGTDSLGFFNSDGEILKAAGDPLDILTDSDFRLYLKQRVWFVAGHTRQATQGAITHKNAHPFRYGRIIGAHNGVVIAPERYEVDSEYLIDLLQNPYQEALENVEGYWGLSWFDGTHFYLQAQGTSVAIGRKGGTYYYSSDWAHLMAATGIKRTHVLDKGQTVRFTAEGIETCLRFVTKRPVSYATFLPYAKYGKLATEAEADWDRDTWSEYAKEYD